jgi:WD40 repeat protein
MRPEQVTEERLDPSRVQMDSRLEAYMLFNLRNVIRTILVRKKMNIDSNGSSGIVIWNTSTGILVRTISANIEEMAWSPNGQYIASSTRFLPAYGAGGNIQVWRAV